MSNPLVTVAVPSFNQGRYLGDALESIFAQDVPVEVFVLDGGSTDESLDVIHAWKHRLAGWRSGADRGQSAAINEGIARGGAPFVCWLNCDDWLLPGGLALLSAALRAKPHAPAAYGRCWNFDERSRTRRPVSVEPFDERRLALRCIVAQPATLIRRTTWKSVGGLDEGLRMAMDYDLWWKLYRRFGPPEFVDGFAAVNRDHPATKTRTMRRLHYDEAIGVVRAHYGHVPLKWWLYQPYAVWLRSIKG